MPELRPDQILFGRYRLLRPLRADPASRAWLARDERSGASVAVWLLPSEITETDVAAILTAPGTRGIFPPGGSDKGLVIEQSDPAAFSRLAAQLERCLAEFEPDVGGELIEAERFDAIAPAEFRPAEPAPAPAARRGVPAKPIVALLVLAVFAIVAVFVYLPRYVTPTAERVEPGSADTAETVTNQAGSPAQPAGPPSSEIAPWEMAQILRQKEAAEAVLEEFVRLQFALEELHVNAWGETEFLTAQDDARRGDGLFSQREYEAATEAYQTGLDRLRALEHQAPRVLEEALARGAEALARFDGTASRGAFELALLLDEDNETATRGLARSATIEEVGALLGQARADEDAGNLEGARRAYERIRALDAEVEEASEGLARVAARLEEQRFDGLMSDGYAALTEGRLQAAGKAFREARALRPGSAEVTEALAQVDMQSRLGRIAVLREQAADLEGKEQWPQAVGVYEQALELDPNLLFAREGLARARERSELDTRLADYIANPERLGTDAVHAAAEQLLRVAVIAEPRGPRLAQQIAALERELTAARVPVTVKLLSDNHTEVTVFRVGRFGSFDSREIELRPGEYTVVGTRDGYRDVRRTFTVIAGQTPEPVVVRCEEKI